MLFITFRETPYFTSVRSYFTHIFTSQKKKSETVDIFVKKFFRMPPLHKGKFGKCLLMGQCFKSLREEGGA